MRSFPIVVLVLLATDLCAQTVRVGEGRHTYAWDAAWGARPDGSDLGNTHGCVVVDSKGLVYFNTDTSDSVMVFDRAGKLVRTWGKELMHGLHGMTLAREGDKEFLYLCHTSRHEVLKTTLTGEILWRLRYPQKSGVYESADQFKPTAVAVGPDGSLFVADGYGLSWIHKFDAERRYVKSFGGPGTEPGKLRVPHGLFMDTRGKTPRLVVCDRENNRLQTFDLEGEHLGVVSGMLRRPCNISAHGDDIAVADLAGRVTILDGDLKLVCHLGDNPDPARRAQNRVPREEWKDGEFLSPHGVAFDPEGNLYVADWNYLGRVTRLARVR